MPQPRINMRKLKEILRLRLQAQLSIRQIAASTQLSVGVVQKVVRQAQQSNLTWAKLAELNEYQITRLVYPTPAAPQRKGFIDPDWGEIHQELKRKGVTKQLLWQEYGEQHPNLAYSYSQFCARYMDWSKKLNRSMRQHHKAGEKCFIDYCGPTVPIVDPTTGEIRNAQIFVAAMGASNYTYAEATYSQGLQDWLSSHVRLFDFLGGVPELLVPDNLRSGVSKACRYEPELNPSYQQLAEHYRVAVMPARPYKPKDKAKAEVAVLVVERWILARLRKQTFFSLAELNQCIQVLLEDLNSKPFKQLPGNRKQAFKQLDQPMLRPLPKQRYVFTQIKNAKVNIDYHLVFDQHFYSVPHTHVGEQVQIHATETLIQVFFRGNRIASHARSYKGGMSTDPSHMPPAHKAQAQWTPQRLQQWAECIGPETGHWVQQRLNEKVHPEQAYRLCLGLLNLTRQYPAKRVNQACALANREGLTHLKPIKNILKSNRDQLQTSLPLNTALPQDHANVRGPKDFH